MRLIPTSITQRTIDPNDPTEGRTLDALMLRQKQLMQQKPEVPSQIASPWQGAALMANTFVNNLQQKQAQAEEAAGRKQLSEAMSRSNPQTGELPPDAMATIGRLDPDTQMEFIKAAIQSRRDAAKVEHWVDIPTPQGETGQWQQNQLTGEKQKRGAAGITVNTGDGTDAKMPDWAAKDVGYYSGASMANMDLEDFDTDLTSGQGKLASFVPGGNYLTSPQYKQALAAGKTWIMNILRRESGAAIGEQELKDNMELYLPQPGDDADTIAYKRQLRQQKTASLALGIRSAAPNTYKDIQAGIDQERNARAERKKKPNEPKPGSPEDVAAAQAKAQDALKRGAKLEDVNKMLTDNGYPPITAPAQGGP